MITANLARIAVLVTAIAIIESVGVSLGLLIAIALVFGLVDAMYNPASNTMPRQLVRASDLGAVAAMLQWVGGSQFSSAPHSVGSPSRVAASSR